MIKYLWKSVLFPVISPTHHPAWAHHFHQLFFTFPHFKLQCGGGDGWAGDSLHTAGRSATSPQEARLFLKLVAPVKENLDFGEKLLFLDFSLLMQMLLLCLLIKINEKVHSRKKSKCWVECIYTASPIPKHKSSFLHFKRQLAPSFLNRKLKYMYLSCMIYFSTHLLQLSGVLRHRQELFTLIICTTCITPKKIRPQPVVYALPVHKDDFRCRTQHFSSGTARGIERSYSKREHPASESTNISIFFFEKLICHKQMVPKEMGGKPHHHLFLIFFF